MSTDKKKEELWQNVPGYKGVYQISTHGRVRKDTFDGFDLMSPGTIKDGYKQVGFTDTSGVRKRFQVHRLVVAAFIGELTGTLQVNHKNGVVDDNYIENLEIMTPKENVCHAIEVLGQSRSGENGVLAKLTTAQVVRIRELCFAGHTYAEVGEQFGITRTNARFIAIRRTWVNAGGPLCSGSREGWNHSNSSNPAKKLRTKSAAEKADNPQSQKITDAQVVEMREARVGGAPYKELVSQFGVSRSQVALICLGQSRLHAGGPIAAPTRKAHNRTVLSQQDIAEIRLLRSQATNLVQLARKFNTSVSEIREICKGLD